MNIMRMLILLLVAQLLALQLTGQDPIFSQFFAAPLQVNPAFTGAGSAPHVGTIYRHQWPNLSNAFRTYNVYYEQPLEQLNSGIGFQLEGDNAGDGLLKSTRASALYAYNLPVGRKYLIRIGVEAGIRQAVLDWNRLIFPDQIDGVDGVVFQSGETPPDNNTVTNFDASAGLLLLSDQFWLGTSLKHLNTPDDGFLLINNNLSDGLPIRYTVHAGSELIVKKGNKLQRGAFVSPNVLFVSQGPFQQLNLGAYTGVGALYGGLWYRHTFGNADAVIAVAGVREGIFKFGFSYDLTVSGLSGYTGGSYEVSLGLFFDRQQGVRKRTKQTDWSDCLNMFR
jgi:type IX secretion system PorP/SprF family membrane protein